VVWTERALRAGKFSELRQQLRAVWPNDERIPQVILAPSGTDREEARSLPGFADVLVLEPFTPRSALSSNDFDRYCDKTLQDCVTQLGLELSPCPLPREATLGVHARSSKEIQENAWLLFERVKQRGSKFARFAMYSLLGGDEHLYYGADLLQLAEKYLIAKYGLDPAGSLYVVNVPDVRDLSVDWMIAASRVLGSAKITLGTVLNIGEPFSLLSEIREPGTAKLLKAVADAEPDKNFIEAGADGQVLDEVVRSFAFAAPFYLHPRAKDLQERKSFYARLDEHRQVAMSNMEAGRQRYHEFTDRKLPWSQKPCDPDAPDFKELFEDGDVFDHRSGAISFDPYRWERMNPDDMPRPWGVIYRYFDYRQEEPWQQDRPNYWRVLATPTKIILRGEEYYANLRNVPPIQRLQDLLKATKVVVRLCQDEDPLSYSLKDEWKLSLALFDQLRNCALQLAWFTNQLIVVDSFSDYADETLRGNVDQFLDRALYLYYAVLGGRGRSGTCREELKKLGDEWQGWHQSVQMVLGRIERRVKDGWREDRDRLYLKTNKLIRRWREADHPGENALLALHALAHKMRDGRLLPGVGIGWGGVELPVAYRAIARVMGLPDSNLPAVYIASYSKYAKHGSSEPELRGMFDAPDLNQLDREVLLFDDNVLSGKTIQVVSDHLFLKHQRRVRAVFVTRISGERRYDQMRMEERGGALNPCLVGNKILGHLGETPFARTWSREIYKNPIGVFNVAKRRILELLVANSSADRFDREGF
jgi:hypothetical protein